jgi:hypothetical protein
MKQNHLAIKQEMRKIDDAVIGKRVGASVNIVARHQQN